MKNEAYDHTNIVDFIKKNPEVGLGLINGTWKMTLRKFEECFGPHGFSIIKPKSYYCLAHKDSDVLTQLKSVKATLHDIYDWSVQAKENTQK